MNTPEPRPAAPRARRFPLVGWLGLPVLAATVAIAAGAPGWGRSPKASDAAPADATPSSRGGARAACFGYVDVEQGVAPLYPVQPGRVVEVLTKEGATVEAGAPLFRVDDALAKLRVREAKAALAAAEARLAQARTLPEQHRKEIDARRAATDAARQEAEAARGQRDKARRLLDKEIGSSKEDVSAAEALVRKAEAAVHALESQVAAMETVDPQLGVKLAEQDLAAKKVDVEKAELAVKECTVTAPAKGSVLRLSVSPGEVLGPSPRQPALLFCPDAPRIIRAEVEQEFADHVAIGQAANFQDDATGTGSWTGKVARVSDWYTHRRSVLLEPMQYNDVRTLECIIEVPPGQAPLRIGQRVRVMLGSLEP